MAEKSRNRKPLASGMPEVFVNSRGNANATSKSRMIVATAAQDRQDTCPSDVIRLPNGKPVGKLSWEAGLLVWMRNVSPAHILRMRDAWTINYGILQQLGSLSVVLLRYIAADGVYELPLEEFRRKAQRHPKFAAGEDVYSMPRREWRFRPNLCQLELFGIPSTS